MLHACFVRSPIARARILGIDTSEALALPGVHAVFVAADLNPDVHEAWFTLTGPDMPDTPRPPLAEDEVRFVGDPVALVVADSRYIAEDAVELVVVDYEPLPALADYVAADGSDELVHPNFPGNVAGAFAGQAQEQVDEVFAAAAHAVGETIFQQAYTAVPIETRGLVVEWSAGSGELTIWSATQAPHEVRAFCSRLLGLPEQRIRVVMRDTGGGFGQKVVPLREDMCLMLAARKVPAAAEVDRGPAREPHGGGAGPARARRRRGSRSTTTARSWRCASTTCRTSVPTPRPRRSPPAWPSGCCSPGRTASRARPTR